MKISRLLLTIGVAATLAGEADAADRTTDRFTTQVQQLAGWYGVEVDRIAVVDGQVRATGVNRQGSPVVLTRACGESGITCPPALLAQRETRSAAVARARDATGVATSGD